MTHRSTAIARGRKSTAIVDLWLNRSGVSAVEFALIAPVILLILAGTLDLGRALMTKFEVTSAISASTNYALLNASRVDASSGAALASEIAKIADSNIDPGQGSITVVINNGSAITVQNGVTKTSGTASNADSCYCPASSGGAVTWGAKTSCGSTCGGGGIAGRFVTIVASKPFTPMFGGFGLVKNDAIAARAVVQPQ